MYEAVDKSSGNFRDALVARLPHNSINSRTNSSGYIKLIQVNLETLINILLLVFLFRCGVDGMVVEVMVEVSRLLQRESVHYFCPQPRTYMIRS
jgi:hypothetical protein